MNQVFGTIIKTSRGICAGSEAKLCANLKLWLLIWPYLTTYACLLQNMMIILVRKKVDYFRYLFLFYFFSKEIRPFVRSESFEVSKNIHPKHINSMGFPWEKNYEMCAKYAQICENMCSTYPPKHTLGIWK